MCSSDLMAKRAERGKAYYMISAVSQKYDIHPQTLRLYEREGLLKPSRTEGNTRLYSEEDLEQLETILSLTRDLGVNLAGVEIILNMGISGGGTCTTFSAALEPRIKAAMLPRAIPPCATTSARDKTSAATVADVRRGAWSRLSAANAPSTGRIHFSGTRSTFTRT